MTKRKRAPGELTIAQAKKLPEILLGPEHEENYVLALQALAAQFAASQRQRQTPEISFWRRLIRLWR